MAIDSSSEEAKSQNVARRKSDFIIISVSASTTRAKKSSPSLPSPLAPTPLRENIANFLFPLPLPSQTNGRGRRCHLNSMREKKVDALRPFAVDLHKGPRLISSHIIPSCLANHPLLYVPCLSAPCACAFDNRLNSHSQSHCKPRACVWSPASACFASVASLPHPSIFHLSGLDRRGRPRPRDRGRLSVCVARVAARGRRLSVCSVNLPACLVPSFRSFVRSFVLTNPPPPKPHVRPSVRPSVHSLPRGVQLVSERSRWSGVQSVRLQVVWSKRSVGLPHRGKGLSSVFTSREKPSRGALEPLLQEENSLRPDRLWLRPSAVGSGNKRRDGDDCDRGRAPAGRNSNETLLEVCQNRRDGDGLFHSLYSVHSESLFCR